MPNKSSRERHLTNHVSGLPDPRANFAAASSPSPPSSRRAQSLCGYRFSVRSQTVIKILTVILCIPTIVMAESEFALVDVFHLDDSGNRFVSLDAIPEQASGEEIILSGTMWNQEYMRVGFIPVLFSVQKKALENISLKSDTISPEESLFIKNQREFKSGNKVISRNTFASVNGETLISVTDDPGPFFAIAAFVIGRAVALCTVEAIFTAYMCKGESKSPKFSISLNPFSCVNECVRLAAE